MFKSAWPVASFMNLGYTGACNFLGHDLEANSGRLKFVEMLKKIINNLSTFNNYCIEKKII